MVFTCDATGVITETIDGIAANRLRGSALEWCFRELAMARSRGRPPQQPQQYRFQHDGTWRTHHHEDVLRET